MTPRAILRSPVWACEATALQALIDAIDGVALTDMQRAEAAIEGKPTIVPTVVGDVATIDIRGVLMPDVPWWAHYLGLGMADTNHVRSAIAEAAGNHAVRSIVLAIDSPGGSVAGIAETAQAVRDARAAGKTVSVAVDSMCCSAAYWIASQADQIVAGPTALIGSIGVYVVLADTVQAQKNEGIQLVTVASGGVKGLGADGAVTPERVAEVSRMVAGLYAAFTADVSSGRRLDDARMQAVADGAVHLGSAAVPLGLVDALTFTTGSATAPPSKNPQDSTMKISAATLADLVAAEPAHAALISAAAKADKDEPAIRAEIAAAKAKAKDEQIAALTADLTAERAAHAATKQAVVELQGKHDKLAALGNGAPRDPGGSPIPPPATGAAASDAAIAAEWATLSPEKRSEFLGDQKTFAYWVKSGRPTK